MKKFKPIILAILAACFYAFSSPISKTLLNDISPTILAGLLYLGAGLGIGIIYLFIYKKANNEFQSINKSDRLYVILMVILDIVAPILLLIGLSTEDPASISLINNFEIVMTTIIAFLIFKEKISFKVMISIIIITISVILLSINFSEKITFSYGSLFALLACFCWGLENNCTRKLSSKNPYQIVIIKGLCSGIGSLIIGLCISEAINININILYALLLGFFAYGLSVFFYVIAQKHLGAAKTSAYYATAPFIGVGLSFIIFKTLPSNLFYVSLILMIIGSVLITIDTIKSEKKEEKNESNR